MAGVAALLLEVRSHPVQPGAAMSVPTVPVPAVAVRQMCRKDPGCFDFRKRVWGSCDKCAISTTVVRGKYPCAACFWKYDKEYTPCPGAECRKHVADALALQAEDDAAVAEPTPGVAPTTLRADLDAAIDAQQQQHARIGVLEAEVQRLAIDARAARATTVAREAQVQRLHAAFERLEKRVEEATPAQQQWHAPIGGLRGRPRAHGLGCAAICRRQQQQQQQQHLGISGELHLCI